MAISTKALVIGLIIGLVVGGATSLFVKPREIERVTETITETVLGRTLTETLTERVEETIHETVKETVSGPTVTVTKTVTPTPTPTPTPVEWVHVKTYTGITSVTTDLFYISKNKFRIHWIVEKTEKYDVVLSAKLYDENSQYVELVINYSGGDHEETTYVYEGPGNFYLDISALFCSWTIIIEEPS